MDLSAILAFLLIFIFILAILFGIAYYGVKPAQYPADSAAANNDLKSNSKKQNRQKSLANGKVKPKVQSGTKRKEISMTESESSGGIEEDPIVIIPDPFTNQLTSRFAGAISSTASKSHHNQNGGHLVQRKAPTLPQSHLSTSSNISNVGARETTGIAAESAKPTPIMANGGVTSMTSSSSVTPVDMTSLAARKPVSLTQAATTFTATSTQILAPSEQTTKIELKTKPKATVKPNLTSLQHEDSQQPKLIKVNVVNSKYSTQPIDLLHNKNYEIRIDELNLKVRELSTSVEDKQKKLDQAIKVNTDLKLETTKLQIANKKLSTDLETLRQSNQVIQKELTKSTQRCVVYEKEMTIMQEKFRQEIALKNETTPSTLFVASDQTLQNLEAQISYLQNELSQVQKSQKMAQNENKTYETELGNMNEKNIKLFQSLQTQEALTKQLELQLEKSIPSTQYEAQVKLLKQRDHELNQMRIDNQQLCKNVEELKKIVNDKSNECDSYIKNLQTLDEKNRDLNAQIDVLKSTVYKEESRLVGEASSKEIELNEKADEIKRLNESIVQIQEQHNILKAEAEDYRSSAERFKSAVTELNEKLNQVTTSLENEKADLKQKLEENLANVEKLESRLQQASEKTAEFEHLKIQLEDSYNKIQGLEKQNREMLENIGNEAKMRIDDLEKRLEEANINENNSRESIAKKEEELNDLKIKLENLSNNLKNLEEMKGSSDTQFNEIQSRCENAENQLSFKEQELTQKCNLLSQKEDEINDLKSKLEMIRNDLKNESKSALEEYERRMSEKEAKISELERYLAESSKEKDEEINNLRNRTEELSNLQKDFDNAKNTLMEQTGHKDNEINELRSKIENISNYQQELEQKNRALEEEIEGKRHLLDEFNSTKDKIVQEKDEELRKRENDVRELREKFTSAETEKESHMHALNETKSKCETLEARLSEIESSTKEKDTSKDTEIANLKSQIENILNAQRELENDKNSLLEQIGHKNNEINDCKSKIENISNSQKDLEQQKLAVENQLNESRSRFEEMERRFHEFNQRVDKQENDINEKNVTLIHKENQINELHRQLEHLKDNTRELEGINHELKSKCEMLEKRLSDIERNNNYENLMTNGSANGNGDLNGKHETSDKESAERLKKENILLRKLLDDERKLNKETQREKDKIKDLLKLGHEALEHERIALQERLDEKLQKEHEKTNFNNNGNLMTAVDTNDQQ